MAKSDDALNNPNSSDSELQSISVSPSNNEIGASHLEIVPNVADSNDNLSINSVHAYHKCGSLMCCHPGPHSCCGDIWWQQRVVGQRWIRPRDLISSYFFSPLAVLIIRSILTLWCTIVILASFALAENKGYFFFYFTNLTYIGLTTYFWMSTILAIKHHLNLHTPAGNLKRAATTLEIVTSWVYTSSFAFHILVPIVYWVLLNDPNAAPMTQVNQWANVSRHGMDFVVMLIECLCNRILYQWGHILISYIIVLLYIFWAWIGAAAYPNGPNNGFPYSFLNYNKASNFAMMAGLAIGFFIIWMIVFFLHYFRTLVGKKLRLQHHHADLVAAGAEEHGAVEVIAMQDKL